MSEYGWVILLVWPVYLIWAVPLAIVGWRASARLARGRTLARAALLAVLFTPQWVSLDFIAFVMPAWVFLPRALDFPWYYPHVRFFSMSPFPLLVTLPLVYAYLAYRERSRSAMPPARGDDS